MIKIFKLVISDPGSKKAWQVERDVPALIGMRIGQSFDGSLIGLDGYELLIAGGSDKQGFPMRPDLPGTGRKRVLLVKGPGYKPKRKGVRKRKTVRGSTISDEIVQINCKIVKAGPKPVPELLGLEKKEELSKEEAKSEQKK